MSITNVDLFRQATRRVCDEVGEPWPEGSDAEFDDPSVARLADVFAGLVLENDAELKRIEAYMREHMEQRPCVVHAPSDDTEGGHHD